MRDYIICGILFFYPLILYQIYSCFSGLFDDPQLYELQQSVRFTSHPSHKSVSINDVDVNMHFMIETALEYIYVSSSLNKDFLVSLYLDEPRLNSLAASVSIIRKNMLGLQMTVNMCIARYKKLWTIVFFIP